MRLPPTVATAIVVVLTSGFGSAQSQGRTDHYSLPVAETAFYIGNCGSFDVLSAWEGVMHGVVVYDKDGLPVREELIYKIRGQSTYYNSSDPTKFVLGAPGEVQTTRVLYDEGSAALVLWHGMVFKVIVPGYGPIFLETGRAIYDTATGQVLANSGHNQYVDGDLAALCDALQ